MKLVSLFKDFLDDTVNLNQSRIDLLENSIGAIKDFVRQSEWGLHIRGFEEQGSWAHDTIIKPVDGDEFDADLLVLVDPMAGWSAADYVAKLGAVFAASATYGDKVKTWDYCVTITYAGDRKIDIAPLVVGRKWQGSLEVCNRSTNCFEQSEPLQYTAWLKEKNGYSRSNSFRKVTRLIKYLRDIKETFTCPSVLLTTLIGCRIEFFDKDTSAFADTPTTLQTIFGRLDDWLQMNVRKPSITNPKLPTEDFALNWTDAQYANFRTTIHRYRGWIDEAISEAGRSESIKAWRRIFGDGFAKGDEARAVVIASDGLTKARELLLASAAHNSELVEVVRNYGISVLPPEFSRPPHMKLPQWPQDPGVSAAVSIYAEWRPKSHSTQSRFVKAGDVLPASGGLWFDARVNGNEAVPVGYRVEWRITNTGAVALSRQQGRGDFYASNSGSGRWETLAYRGVHIAEAFIVRRRDEVLVGQSAPFYVVIE